MPNESILSHDLSGFLPGFQVTLGVVCEGREIIENDPAIQNGVNEKIILPMLSQAKRFQVASSTLVPEEQIVVA